MTTTTPGYYTIDTSQGDVRLAGGGAPRTLPLDNISLSFNLAAFGGPLDGDFDARVDFRSAAIPFYEFIDQIELQTWLNNDANLFITSYDNDVTLPPFGGLNVHVFDGGVRGVVPLDPGVTGGTFQIVRSGSTLKGLFNGTELFSKTQTGSVNRVQFLLQHNFFSESASSVTFDNFYLSAPDILVPQPPPSPQPVPLPAAAWGGLALIGGLGAARRARRAGTKPLL